MASARQFDDIVEVQENTKGNDFVIGDVHGNRPVLEKMFNALGNDDRLFIVGDLVDKGVDSIGVIEFLNQHTDKIFVIRGNHESLCLDAISSLVTMARGQSQYGGDWKGNLQKIVEIIKTDPENCIQRLLPGNFDTADNRKLINDLKLHMVLNSGEWLANQFLNELLADKITFKSVEEKSDIGLVTKKDYVEFASDSKIKMIQDYMIRLPYILSF